MSENPQQQPEILTPEERQQQIDDLNTIKTNIFSALKTKSAELTTKIEELQQRVNQRCSKLETPQKQNECLENFNEKINQESTIFNNVIFNSQGRAFKCFMDAQIAKESFDHCERMFIVDIDKGIGEFFTQMNRKY